MPFVEGITRFCFEASYGVALAAELLNFVRPRSSNNWVARVFASAGLFAHTAYLVLHHPSPAAPQGSLLLLAWVLAVFSLYGTLHHRHFAWAVFVLPVVLALLILSEIVSRSGPNDLALSDVSWFSGERFWGNVHGSLMVMAAVGVSVAFVASVMYLFHAARLRHKSLSQGGFRLLNLERLETMNRRAVNWAFPLWTAGLLLGAYLLSMAKVPAGDWAALKVIGTGGLWIVFLLLMYLRYAAHARGRRLAVLSILAFGLMIMTLASSHPVLQGVTP